MSPIYVCRSLSGSLHPNVDKMLEKFIRGKEYQAAKYEEARGIIEVRLGIVRQPAEA
jgi:hypothetical protein